ncbi:MAG: TetR/AcrR family transcriptional regulator [Betaproteobacteria bacterium]|nr:TetR/AcrR family transcriptional regulator [Betaproteobacteria bacterium]
MSVAAAKPAPRWTRRKEARPSELVDAALDLFVERGFAATRLEDVAARAGVSKGTVYLYFPNKEELFKAVIRQALVPTLERGRELVDRYQGSTADLLRTLVHTWWKAVGATRLGGIPKLMIAESGNFPQLAQFYYDEVIQRGHRVFAAALERGIASGEFRALDVGYALRVAIAPMIFALLWRHSLCSCDKEPWDFEKYLDMHVDLLVNGLVARHPRARTAPRAAKAKRKR